MADEMISHYRIIEQIGAGGMNGDDLEAIDATISTSSRWINKSRQVVVLRFDNDRIVGRKTVRLNPGETYNRLWRASLWPTKPSMTIVCRRNPRVGIDEDTVMRIRVIGPPPKVRSDDPGGG